MKCRYCKKEIDFQYYEAENDKLKLMEACFSCAFWIEKIPHRNNWRIVIYKGGHYYIGKGGGNKEHHGFAGTKWKIVCKGNSNMANEEDKIRNSDGKILQSTVYTDDLWSQGTIPERFRKLLPDNVIELVSIG